MDKVIVTTQPGWLNVYQESGIAVGKGVLIQNQHNVDLVVLERAQAPADDLYGGRIVPSMKEAEIDAGSPGIWVRTSISGVKLFVQET